MIRRGNIEWKSLPYTLAVCRSKSMRAAGSLPSPTIIREPPPSLGLPLSRNSVFRNSTDDEFMCVVRRFQKISSSSRRPRERSTIRVGRNNIESPPPLTHALPLAATEGIQGNNGCHWIASEVTIPVPGASREKEAPWVSLYLRT